MQFPGEDFLAAIVDFQKVYQFTGKPEKLRVFGWVKIECYGARGNGGQGGWGARAQAYFFFPQPTDLTIIVGGRDGYNGGGAKQWQGGGASDARYMTDSLFARIIVAGGGGGSGNAGHWGGASGLVGSNGGWDWGGPGGGASQTQGGSSWIVKGSWGAAASKGGFGYGTNGASGWGSGIGAGSGGGGWYGGAGGCVDHSAVDDSAGGGGSSFIWCKDQLGATAGVSEDANFNLKSLQYAELPIVENAKGGDNGKVTITVYKFIRYLLKQNEKILLDS